VSGFYGEAITGTFQLGSSLFASADILELPRTGTAPRWRTRKKEQLE
jgi:hypothetical protein